MIAVSASRVNQNPVTQAAIKAQLAKRSDDHIKEQISEPKQSDTETKKYTVSAWKSHLSRQLAAAQFDIPVHTRKSVLLRVCWFYGVSPREVSGPSRSREIVLARKAAMYWMRELCGSSYPEIGRRLGGRDHTTALHGIRTYTESKRNAKTWWRE